MIDRHLLPRSSFLRKLPSRLDRTQSLKLQGLVFSADALEVAFRRACHLGPKLPSLDSPDADETEMFIVAWSMVDHLYATRQLLSSLIAGAESEHSDFFMRSRPAATLRNYMDHLGARAGNTAHKKSSFPLPLFGAVTYFVPTEWEGEAADRRIVKGNSVVLTSGSLDGNTGFQLALPGERPVVEPMDFLTLTACDAQIEFRPALLSLGKVLADLSDRTEAQAKEQAEAANAKTGEAVESILQSGAGDYAMAFEIAFSGGHSGGETTTA